METTPRTSTRRLSDRLNHGWRVFATGFVFVLFGLGAIFISATSFPVIRAISWNPDVARRRIQRTMRHAFRFYVELMCSLGIMTYTVTNLERLNEKGRLIIANHPTLIDVVILVSLMPEVDCIVKRGLWRNPFLRWPVLWASYIPNSEGEELIDTCSARLRQGHSLLVFPEGTRSVPGRPLKMQRGAAHIALAAETEILPVRITCEPITLFKGNPWHRVPSRRFHVQIDVGSPVPVGDFQKIDEPASKASRRLTQWMLNYYTSAESDAQTGPGRVKSPSDRGSPVAALN